MIDELVGEIAAKTRLTPDQASRLLAGALALIRKHADPAKVAALFDATPGAAGLALAAPPLPKPGLLGGMVKAAGGAAMADGMALLQQLSKVGVGAVDLQDALPVASDWVRERTGQDLLGEALTSIPGAGRLLGGD